MSSPKPPRPLERALAFCDAYSLRAPILLAPMAGTCPPSLSIAVANAGGLGACGALLMAPDAIASWVSEVRAACTGGFQINLWVPDPPARRDAAAEDAVRRFLMQWGPAVDADAGDATPPDFASQCEAILASAPFAISSIMGLFPSELVVRLKARSIRWLATATTVSEARAAEAAGADAIIAQGAEAGGHRGAFDPAKAETELVGLFSLVPAIVDAVRVPVIAAGGIVDGRGVAAALLLGASAVQVGTGFLRSPETKLSPAWSAALERTLPEGTSLTRAFSGRAGRSLTTAYVLAARGAGAPTPLPYPVQRGLTRAMRDAARVSDDVDRMQAWAGQSASRAAARPAGEIVTDLWEGARALLS